MTKALIIGGGIAGPVAAMALQRVGVEAEVYEARQEGADEAGAFLQVAPNGMNALKALGAHDVVESGGFTPAGMVFLNARGKRVGELDARGELQRYGVRTQVVKRGHLLSSLRRTAQERGVPLHFGRRLEALERDGSGVTARFADGTQARGDVLVGCDGLHSRVRRMLLPEGPRPVYTGTVDCGGFARLQPGTPVIEGKQVMTFGRRAFFGYVAKPDGEVYWFSNVPWPGEPSREELRASQPAWHSHLLELHADDPSPIPEILSSVSGGVGLWPHHAVEGLPTWHRGPVCLLGDAAHATPPHIGQGASLAMEDALMLARCVRDVPAVGDALARYEQLRRPRVEQALRAARSIGSRKIPNPVMGWVRDLLLPAFLRAGASSSAEFASYTVDFEARAA